MKGLGKKVGLTILTGISFFTYCAIDLAEARQGKKRNYYFDNWGVVAQGSNKGGTSRVVLELGDLGGDSGPDIVFGSKGDGLKIYENRLPKGKNINSLKKHRYSFEGWGIIDELKSRGTSRMEVRLEDLDKDGDLDIVRGSKSDGLVIYENRISQGKK